MAKRLTIGSRAVAVSVVEALVEKVIDNSAAAGDFSPRDLAEGIVAEAWDVEYKPNVERLVLTISAGIEAPDRMRSTPEDQQL